MSSPLEASIPQTPAFASEEHLFQHLEAYPWSTDAEFQSGLKAILGSTPPREAQEGSQQNELILQAKCFYYSRKTNNVLDFEAYKSWLRGRGHPPKAASGTISNDHLPSIDATIEDSVPPNLSKISPPQQHPQSASPARERSSPRTLAPVEEPSAAAAAAATPAGPYPTSFAQIVELIESGKPIPGIEDIPDTVLTGQEGPSKEARRMKPWEMRDVREEGATHSGNLGAELFAGNKGS